MRLLVGPNRHPLLGFRLRHLRLWLRIRKSPHIEAALTEVLPDPSLTRTGGWHWRGYCVNKDLFCGVRYDRLLLLVLENNRGYPLVTYKRDLDLQETHLFALSKDDQFELIVCFLQEAIAGAPLAATTE